MGMGVLGSFMFSCASLIFYCLADVATVKSSDLQHVSKVDDSREVLLTWSSAMIPLQSYTRSGLHLFLLFVVVCSCTIIHYVVLLYQLAMLIEQI